MIHDHPFRTSSYERGSLDDPLTNLLEEFRFRIFFRAE